MHFQTDEQRNKALGLEENKEADTSRRESFRRLLHERTRALGSTDAREAKKSAEEIIWTPLRHMIHDPCTSQLEARKKIVAFFKDRGLFYFAYYMEVVPE